MIGFHSIISDEEKRNEFVMNDSGRIWVGTRSSNYGKPWVFGQFESCGLETAKHILEISDLPDNALSNPIIVTRTFSKMSNSFDDDGILHGITLKHTSYLFSHHLLVFS